MRRLISIHAPARGATAMSCGIGCWKQFQFTPLREGRPALRCAARARSKFQFTPLREGRPQMVRVEVSSPLISIHAPARGATWPALGWLRATEVFQFTPLREGRHSSPLRRSVRYMDFNSRPCERGDLARSGVATGHRGISIHAPARGATT